MANSLLKLDPNTLSVGIVGYTGESGKALTTEILKKNLFKQTVLIGRRNVEYTEEFYKNGIQKIVDFDKLSEYDDVFKGLDAVYCCLGTTKGKSGAEGFRKVDFDYVYETAKIAKKNGCKQFHLVSSVGANKNSFFLYPKTKGEAEEAVSNLNFEKTAFYRPKLLVTNRTENRIGERIALAISKPFQILSPSLLSTPIDTLAKSIIENTINSYSDKKVEIIENNLIFELAKLYDNSQKS